MTTAATMSAKDAQATINHAAAIDRTSPSPPPPSPLPQLIATPAVDEKSEREAE